MEFPAFETFPEWGSVVKIVVLAASVAYAWTEGTKWILLQTTFDDKVPDWIWTMIIRIIAVAFAVLAGWWLTGDSWGASIAFVAGIFNTGIIAFGKSFLRKKLEDQGIDVKDVLGGEGKKPKEDEDEDPTLP